MGGSHQREAFFPRDHEHDASVVVLQNKGVLAIVKPRQHDMAALDEPDCVAAGLAEALVQHILDPWAGRVDDRARPDFDPSGERRVPWRAIAPRQEAFGPYPNARAARGR